MLKSSLCDYTDVYIHVKGIVVPNPAVTGAVANNVDKK